MAVDLVLSSGFLAFAAQAGFLRAVEETGVTVDGVCGTSSGALAGALWAAGHDADTVFAELVARSPLGWATPHAAVWRGAFRLDGVIAQLRQWLPPTFDDLPRPVGVGVATADGGHRLVTSGPLPEAVAASCAVPWLFAPVDLEGHPVHDGGVVDRTGLQAWRAHRPGRPIVLHLVARSGSGAEPDLAAVEAVVRSPRSGARLWSLGDVHGRFERSRAEGRRALEGMSLAERGS